MNVSTLNGSILNDVLRAPPGGRFVARAQQLDAEVGQGARVVRIEREPAPRQRHGFVKPVAAGGALAGGAEHLAVTGRDRQRLARPQPRIRLLVLDVRDRGQLRVRLDTRRIDRQRLLQQLSRLGIVIRVGRLLRQKDLRIDRGRVDLENLLGRRDSLRRVVVGQRARRAHDRGRPAAIDLQNRVERFQRLGFVVRFEKQLAPSGIDGGIVRRA